MDRAMYMEYVKSAVITFVAGMAIVILPELNSLTLESFRDGTVVGLLFAAARTGFKGLLEMFLAWYNARQ